MDLTRCLLLTQSRHRRFKIIAVQFAPQTPFSWRWAYLFDVTSVTARTRAARYREGRTTATVGKGDLPMSRLCELFAEKAAPAWSWLVATFNDPNLIAVVFFCLISLLLTAGRLRWNEWYVATHPDGVERSGQVVARSRENVVLRLTWTVPATDRDLARPARETNDVVHRADDSSIKH